MIMIPTRFLFFVLVSALILGGGLTVRGEVVSSSRYAYGGNLGWIDLLPDSTDPAVGLDDSTGVCSGYVHSANVGWIHFGDGTPDNGSQYSNSSETDYGVNIDGAGYLTGYAYGANIGWINFGQGYSAGVGIDDYPRLTNDGLSGYAYSANCGWIALGEVVHVPGDTDLDGMPDSWEMGYLGYYGFDPNDFPTLMTASTDNDGDGATDLAEYQAGTNPFDANDKLKIVSLERDTAAQTLQVTWTSHSAMFYHVETSTDLRIWDTLPGRIPGAPGAVETTVEFDVDFSTTPRLFTRIRPERP